MYYSEVSKCTVSKLEALKQIIDLCGRWYRITGHDEDDLDKYLEGHPQLLDIEQWNCFVKLERENQKISVEKSPTG
jgi:hypothetical protein